MVDMPKECEQCRLQLMIEYNRLLAWGESVGLIDVPQGSHVAVSLGTNAIELCSIVSRIGWLLGEFRDMNARWKNELHPFQKNDQETMERVARDIDVVKEVSSLAVAYEKAKEERRHLRGTNHVIKWMSKGAENAREIITHPFRVRWVMVDKEAFEALLKDLHFLTERIHELMGEYRENRIQEITSKTYREMILARNDINELRDLLDAVASLLKASETNTNAICRKENDEILQDLLRLKEINCVSNELVLRIENDADLDIEKDLKGIISVNQYDADTLRDHFTYAKAEGTKDFPMPRRPRGVLNKDGVDFEVWIEWRTIDDIVKGTLQDKESKLRTATLAQMLHNKKPRHLYSPICIGYIDDCERHNRHGWIFKMPDGSNEGTTLKTLHSMLGQSQHKPTLSQRISLAWKLASSLLYLHTTSWLHKGIHSGNVIFSFDEDRFDPEKPILSGFEYSRPQSNRTTTRSLDPQWDIYRWPSIQNEMPKMANSRKTYDIYSLGLVLLEIAHWKPLHTIMCLKRWPEPSAQNPKIRGWLLGEERRPPFKDSNPLSGLRDIAGDKYWRAASRCLVAHGDMGMRVEEGSDQSHDSKIGIKLQNAFTEFVVEELKGVSI